VDGGIICFGGSFHEQAIIPTGGAHAPSGGIQQITVPLRRPHINNTVVMQGGVCGTALEVVNDTSGGLIYPFDVLGSTTANTIQATFFRTAQNNFIPPNIASLNATMSITALASGGTLVTGSNNFNGQIATGSTIQISGASDSAFNALCTGIQWPVGGQFTCTIAGLTGTHTATTATGTVVGLNGFNLYNMAEVIDVQNEAVNPPAVDGTLALEPNVMQISTSDSMAELHSAAGIYKTYSAAYSINDPYSIGGPFVINMAGRGVQGGGGSLSTNSVIAISNSNAAGSPNILGYTGPYFIGQNYNRYPDSVWLNMQVNSSTDSRILDPKFLFNLWNIIGNTSNFTFNYSPYGGDSTMSGVRYLALNSSFTAPGPLSGPISITGNTQLLASTKPTVTAVLSNTGGTIPDSTTRCYTIAPYTYAAGTGAAINGIPSTEACVTTGPALGGTSSVKVTWTAVSGANNYRVCFGASGAEGFVFSANGPTATLTWIDTGVLTAGTPCSTLADPQQHPYIDGAAWVGFNSQGTAFSSKLTAPTGVGAGYIELLPLTATAGQLIDIANSTTTVANDLVCFSNTTGRVKDCGTAGLIKNTISFTPSSPGANTCGEQTVAVVGAVVGQSVVVNPPGAFSGNVWIAYARVSASGVVSVNFCAGTGTGTMPSGNWSFLVY
jgi:hypothetical protein